MCEVNEAVKRITIRRGNHIKNSEGYGEYIESVLKEHNIVNSETGEETVEVFVRVFKMGAVDAMTYDVGSALALGNKDDVEDWTSKEKRREILREKFLEG